MTLPDVRTSRTCLFTRFFRLLLVYLFLLVLLTRRTNNLKKFVLCTQIFTSMVIRLCSMRANQGGERIFDRWFFASHAIRLGPTNAENTRNEHSVGEVWMGRCRHCDDGNPHSHKRNRHFLYHCVNAACPSNFMNVWRIHPLWNSLEIEFRQ